MERNFALYDSDVFYATRFMEYFKKKRDFDFEILAFTRKESLLEYLQDHKIEILLLGGQMAPEEVEAVADRIKYIYQLTDNHRITFDNRYPAVNRYQAAQAVMTEIITDYRKKENVPRDISNTKQMQIISVFSPTLNMEALSFSWCIGHQLSEQKKALLVLFELLPVQFLASADNKQALSEFIYYLKENSNIILKMNSLLGYSGNLAFLSGVTHGADVLALGKEDVHKWLEELRDHTDYQTVILYLGCYTEAAIEVMKLSDTVLLTGSDTEYEKALQKEWVCQMERAGINIDQGKYKLVLLQTEAEIKHLPIPFSDLTKTSHWSYSKQILETIQSINK